MELFIIEYLKKKFIKYVKILENIFELYSVGFSRPIANPICYYYYGLYFQIFMNCDKMKEYYGKAISLGESMAMNNLGHYYFRNAHDELAKKYYHMAIKKNNS
jgi:TPR repeat protein